VIECVFDQRAAQQKPKMLVGQTNAACAGEDDAEGVHGLAPVGMRIESGSLKRRLPVRICVGFAFMVRH
jgi:hypothetical protein